MSASRQAAAAAPAAAPDPPAPHPVRRYIRKKCPHGKLCNVCATCGGAGLCPHSKQRARCAACGGSGVCHHGKRRNVCVACGGSSTKHTSQTRHTNTQDSHRTMTCYAQLESRWNAAQRKPTNLFVKTFCWDNLFLFFFVFLVPLNFLIFFKNKSTGA